MRGGCAAGFLGLVRQKYFQKSINYLAIYDFLNRFIKLKPYL